MIRRACGKLLLSLLAGGLLSGCSTVVNSHSEKAEMMTAYSRGDNAAVSEEIEYKLREPSWYNTSVVNSGDEIMWRLEAGSMNFHAGNFKESIRQFSIAERLIHAYDDRAKVSVRDVGAEAGAALTNLNTLPYRGLCRDRMALAVYKSLAYLGSGNEAAFRAQLRRLRGEQKKIQEEYREFFEQQKAELEEEKRQNPEAAEKSARIESEISDGNDELNRSWAELKEIAHRGYGNFLNPAAIFLSALGAVRDENFENARIDFQRLCEAMPNQPAFKRYYVTALRKSGRPVPPELEGVEPFDFPLDRDCVYVIFANGRSAAFKQVAIYVPIMTAWPVCEFYDAPFEKARIEADGKSYETLPLADMDGILAQEFDERLPGIITRIVLGTLIKEGAYYGGLAVIWNSDMDSTAKAITWLSVALIGAAYRSAMNTADTRSWELLPKEFQLTQFPMPENREIAFRLQGKDGGIERAVRIPPESRSAIVFISAPNGRNVACHVLPITSK